MGGWMIGVMCGLIFSLLFAIYLDDPVHIVEGDLDEAYQVCEIANSTPYSYDVITVTCKNGAKMKFDILDEE